VLRVRTCAGGYLEDAEDVARSPALHIQSHLASPRPNPGYPRILDSGCARAALGQAVVSRGEGQRAVARPGRPEESIQATQEKLQSQAPSITLSV